MWVSTPEKDISFEHCGKPAYWEGEDVYCSKCQEKLEEDHGVVRSLPGTGE